MKNRIRERSFAECVEQLVIANIKLTKFDHMKQKELQKEFPSLKAIARWELGARSENERRAEARAAIDELLSEIVEMGAYSPLPEVRTFEQRSRK